MSTTGSQRRAWTPTVRATLATSPARNGSAASVGRSKYRLAVDCVAVAATGVTSTAAPSLLLPGLEPGPGLSPRPSPRSLVALNTLERYCCIILAVVVVDAHPFTTFTLRVSPILSQLEVPGFVAEHVVPDSAPTTATEPARNRISTTGKERDGGDIGT